MVLVEDEEAIDEDKKWRDERRKKLARAINPPSWFRIILKSI